SGDILTSTTTGTDWVSPSTITVGNATNASDADKLDGLDSLDFLRSNTTDSYTSGTLSFAASTILDINAGATLDVNGDLTIADTDITFDGASTNFTTTGDFSINTSQLFVEKNTGNIGLG